MEHHEVMGKIDNNVKSPSIVYVTLVIIISLSFWKLATFWYQLCFAHVHWSDGGANRFFYVISERNAFGKGAGERGEGCKRHLHGKQVMMFTFIFFYPHLAEPQA